MTKYKGYTPGVGNVGTPTFLFPADSTNHFPRPDSSETVLDGEWSTHRDPISNV